MRPDRPEGMGIRVALLTSTLTSILALKGVMAMAQLSLYMDDKALDALRADASKHSMSISAYAREVLEKRNDANTGGWVNGWPPGYFELFGSCPDFPDVEDLQFETVEPLFP